MDSARHRDIAFSRDYSSLIANEMETSLKVTFAYLKLIRYVFHELLRKGMFLLFFALKNLLRVCLVCLRNAIRSGEEKKIPA